MIDKVKAFVEAAHVSDSIGAMEQDLERATAYAQYIGELANQREEEYKKHYLEQLARLDPMESETETTRKAKLEAWTAEKKRELLNTKLLYQSLKSIRMTLFQAIKTRRTEPY